MLFILKKNNIKTIFAFFGIQRILLQKNHYYSPYILRLFYKKNVSRIKQEQISYD